MIRERSIQSATYTAGTTQVLDLSRDAVYHILQLEFTGSFVNTQGCGSTGVTFDDCFPFSILKNIRLVRNGSDVVFQGSGCLLAKEHYYLNEVFPHARLYFQTASVETLMTSTAAGSSGTGIGAKGINIPANDEGIGITQVQFVVANSSTSTTTVNFDFQVDLFLQMGPADAYYTTLLDARKLATYQLIIDYASVADFSIPGSVNGTNTCAATGRILSYDQDNLPLNSQYGTFKRSTLSFANLVYGSSNQQVLLPRGNYFHGLILDCLAAKAASTTVLSHENAVITTINNRINSNFTLRQVNWEDLQRKNQADGCCNSAYSGSRGLPNGTAYFYYPCVGDRGVELVPTHVMDQFDLQLSLATATTSGPGPNAAINGPENGVTTGSTNPTINMLLQEVIPGVPQGAGYPQSAQAGSIRGTSAKPYAG